MNKYAWLAIGTILMLAGIALVVIDNFAIGIVLIVASFGFDLLFAQALLAEQRERAAKP